MDHLLRYCTKMKEAYDEVDDVSKHQNVMQVRRRTNQTMRRRQTVATWLMLSLLVMHALFTLNCRVLHHHGGVLDGS
jgi:hypothetical protein